MKLLLKIESNQIHIFHHYPFYRRSPIYFIFVNLGRNIINRNIFIEKYSSFPIYEIKSKLLKSCVSIICLSLWIRKKKEIKLNILSIMRSDSSKYLILWYKK